MTVPALFSSNCRSHDAMATRNMILMPATLVREAHCHRTRRGMFEGHCPKVFGLKANCIKTLASVADAAFDSPNKR
jgi:hypothetical protein